MSQYLVLIIEDDTGIAELVSDHMENQGYSVETATTGEEGFALALKQIPHLIVLDLVLPGMNGFDLLRKLKQDPMTKAIPIVVVSALTDETDIIIGLELGVDEYITKPFSLKILAAKVRALLRKTYADPIPEGRALLQFNGIALDPLRHQVFVDGEEAILSPSQFSILNLLMKDPGSVFSRTDIIAAVRGNKTNVTNRSVDVHIVVMRRILGAKGDNIETIRGVGYRLGIPNRNTNKPDQLMQNNSFTFVDRAVALI